MLGQHEFHQNSSKQKELIKKPVDEPDLTMINGINRQYKILRTLHKMSHLEKNEFYHLFVNIELGPI